jgi:serine/threonine protein kinase
MSHRSLADPIEKKGSCFDIGPYRCFGEVIGKGSFSKVYLGEHILRKERVAIKKVDLYHLTSRNPQNADKLKMRLKIEIQIAQECHHPHLIRLLDVFEQEENDCVYLVFEYCEGGDLSSYLRTKGRC